MTPTKIEFIKLKFPEIEHIDPRFDIHFVRKVAKALLVHNFYKQYGEGVEFAVCNLIMKAKGKNTRRPVYKTNRIEKFKETIMGSVKEIMKQIKTIKGLALELTKREGKKKQVDIAQMREILSNLSDICFEYNKRIIKKNEIDYISYLLTKNGFERAKKKAKSCKGKAK